MALLGLPWPMAWRRRSLRRSYSPRHRWRRGRLADIRGPLPARGRCAAEALNNLEPDHERHACKLEPAEEARSARPGDIAREVGADAGVDFKDPERAAAALKARRAVERRREAERRQREEQEAQERHKRQEALAEAAAERALEEKMARQKEALERKIRWLKKYG